MTARAGKDKYRSKINTLSQNIAGCGVPLTTIRATPVTASHQRLTFGESPLRKRSTALGTVRD